MFKEVYLNLLMSLFSAVTFIAMIKFVIDRVSSVKPELYLENNYG